MQNIKVENQMLGGGLWFAAWLFTIAFLKLSLLQAILAVVIWPYYLGNYFSVAV